MSLKLSEQGEYQDITRIGKSIPIKEEVGENYNFTKNDFYNRIRLINIWFSAKTNIHFCQFRGGVF